MSVFTFENVIKFTIEKLYGIDIFLVKYSIMLSVHILKL